MYNTKEIACPYCEHEYDLCHDDGAFYREDERKEEQCPNCDKKYLVSSSVSWHFEAEIAECLNTGEHKWEKLYPKYITDEHPSLAKKELCADCGEERTNETI